MVSKPVLAAIATALAFLAPGSTRAASGKARPDHGAPSPKVVIISVFGPEGKVWLDHLGP